jgi:hypothetical protein
MASEGKDCSDRWVRRTYHSLVRAVEPWLRVLFCGTAGRTSISLAMPTRIVASIIQLRTCIHHMRNWQVLSFALGFVCVFAGMTCGPTTYVYSSAHASNFLSLYWSLRSGWTPIHLFILCRSHSIIKPFCIILSKEKKGYSRCRLEATPTI